MLSLPQESSIDVRLLERMQEENTVTSYNLFWFRGIFKEIMNRNKEITFRKIVCRMIVEAWNPLSEHKLLEFLGNLVVQEVGLGIRNLYKLLKQ